MLQLKLHMITIEDLVPEEHFLRKLETALDLSFVREATRDLYSRRYGRPPIDPVVLVKFILLGFLYGIPSERQIEEQCKERPAFRWYLGLDLDEAPPDHSTISQNRRRPAFRKVFRQLFEEVVRQSVEAGLVSGRLIATNSTHVKASASLASEYLADVDETPGAYWERLDAYEEKALDELEGKTGHRRGKRTKQVKRRVKHPQRRMSRTDPEAGYLNRPSKPHGMYYLSHQTLDTDHGMILDVAVTPGDASDQIPYLDQVERVLDIVSVQAATADSIYDFGLAHQVLDEHGISFRVRPMNFQPQCKVEFDRSFFTYDQKQDLYCCPGSVKSYAQKRLQSGLERGQYAKETSTGGVTKSFMFMYFLLPHCVPATWRRRAQTSISAELPSGKQPTTLVLRRISRLRRSMTLLVRMRIQCSLGK